MRQNQRGDHPGDADGIGGLICADSWTKLDVKKGHYGRAIQQIQHIKKGDALDELDALKKREPSGRKPKKT